LKEILFHRVRSHELDTIATSSSMRLSTTDARGIHSRLT